MHTPGPWVKRNIASKDMYVGPANDGGAPSVAIIPKRITRSDDEQMANALLIAAAPSLLEALQLVTDLSSTEWQSEDGKRQTAVGNDGKRFHFITTETMSAAHAAIAAATGVHEP